MSEKIDWGVPEDLEFLPTSGWNNYEIVSAYASEGGWLVICRRKGTTYHQCVRVTDYGEHGGVKIIRNRPKRVTLEECWVIYTAEGVQYASTTITDLASEYKKKGFIIRHIPAEEREV